MDKKTRKIIVARAVVKDGKEAAFIDAAKAVVEATRKEPGCFSYTLYQSPMAPASFIFYEEYEDDAAIDTHANSDHFKVFARAISDILAEELDIQKF
ncbi:MAG: antibiotic biosynthesis monooxygenase [Tannerella sp.]|jgi:quinol monooxygenase YgiN|nr:antibiotic biosynthesis monooxygenase [Tannerella sp.]